MEAMKDKLHVAFLWHMHQPLYKDYLTGKYHLPWVRLHATYSYLDMISILDRFPDIKATFNLTPSLIWQLLDISENKDVDDIFLKLTEKDADDLTVEDKCFILKNFFSCDLKKAIFPIPKYKELFLKRGDDLSEAALKSKIRDFKTEDFRDLQVLFNLVWCGFTLREKDHLVKGLFHKGKKFTEDEKRSLIKKQQEAVSSIIPSYKKLQDKGQIEISTSPFYHPILPLLCKDKSGKGYDFREDAKIQVTRAIELYEKVFGRKPKGFWPPEGSVSQRIIPLLADEGIEWIATDEGIVLESFKGEDILREELIYKAFTAEEDGREISMVFRDINISNAISFRYANMPAKKACEDIIEDIKAIKRGREFHDGDHLVSIILDGENPWPYFEDGGKTFLSETYRHLSSMKDIETVTIGDYLSSTSERKKIKKLHSGSWIDRNFNKWIGSPQKNKAWEYLERVREDLFNFEHPSEKALEELYIAEGSDWFWWYDDFGSEINLVFEELYRLHLSNIYKIMGRKVPYYLTEPIPAGPSAQKVPEVITPGEMASYPKVLIVSSEAIPFAKTGGLADVAGSLPKSLVSLGCDVRVIMPLYRSVTSGNFPLTREARNIRHPLLGGVRAFRLYSNRSGGVTTYFVRRRKYFSREGLYGTERGDYPDNGIRFSFFSKASLAAIKAIDFKPDIIHCNDWQSALIPFYLKFRLGEDDFYRGIKTLFTIHNIAYQGVFNKRIMKKAGIPEAFFNMNDLEFYGKINFMKSGVLYSDAISTVSHRYAEEIMTEEYGYNLDGLLRSKKDSLYGIPNGVDYSIWSPKNDKYIKANYDRATIDKKKECKKDLLEYTKLPLSEDTPLLGCVTRLAEQKGMDLFANIMNKVIKLGAGVIILGKGSNYYNNLFKDLVRQYPRNIYVCNDFNDPLAHKIEAGCDMFIMPSRYEPCGLNQMYSIKYGTPPVVRATGGLDDVIIDFDENGEKGNGFKFGPAKGDALFSAIKRAVDLYNNDKDSWRKLMLQAMSYDLSWEHSAKEYLKLYRHILSLKGE